MIAGIIIEAWKLDIFDKHLEEAGYSYTQGEWQGDMIVLEVECFNAATIRPVIEAAHLACRKSKMN